MDSEDSNEYDCDDEEINNEDEEDNDRVINFFILFI